MGDSRKLICVSFLIQKFYPLNIFLFISRMRIWFYDSPTVWLLNWFLFGSIGQHSSNFLPLISNKYTKAEFFFFLYIYNVKLFYTNAINIIYNAFFRISVSLLDLPLRFSVILRICPLLFYSLFKFLPILVWCAFEYFRYNLCSQRLLSGYTPRHTDLSFTCSEVVIYMTLSVI